MTPKSDTLQVLASFDTFDDEQLDKLLTATGVVPLRDRGLKLHQAVIVWFHGEVPHLNALLEGIRELEA